MKIAIYDSGIGGLTVLHEALRQLENEDYIYFSDCSHAPYGTKKRDAVLGYILEAVDFISRQDIKALVVACNTATSVAIGELRAKYDFPVLGMEPAVKPALRGSHGGTVLVLATELTLREEKFQNLIERVCNDGKIEALPAPKLVDFAESFTFDRAVVHAYLDEILQGRDLSQYGTVVLGCTHFPFFRSIISDFFHGGVEVIDGGEGTIRHLSRVLSDRGTLSNSRSDSSSEPRVIFYNSGELIESPERYEGYLKFLREGKV